jgi:short-subunit dehydrogenase
MTDFSERYGPVALVTGASSGIGRAFAQVLAARGLDVMLLARRVDRLETLAAQLEGEHGVRAIVCPVDLTKPDAASTILDAAAGLDVGLVVSNAGFGLKGEHAANDPQAIADMIAVNCITPALLTRGFIPRLRARGKGGVILTGSVEGLIGCPYSAAYSASKGFVTNLGEALWAELSPEGIDVLTILPGATATEAAGLQGIDISRLQNVMSPDDVARLALDALADGPTLITSEHYRAVFDHLLAMPRHDALVAMARSMKP